LLLERARPTLERAAIFFVARPGGAQRIVSLSDLVIRGVLAGLVIALEPTECVLPIPMCAIWKLVRLAISLGVRNLQKPNAKKLPSLMMSPGLRFGTKDGCTNAFALLAPVR